MSYKVITRQPLTQYNAPLDNGARLFVVVWGGGLVSVVLR